MSMVNLRVLLVPFFGLLGTLPAQDPPVPAVRNQDALPTVAALQARVDEVQADQTLAEDLKTSLLEVLNQALASRREGAAFEAAANAFKLDRDNAPAELETKRRELADLGPAVAPSVPAGATTRTLEQRFAEAQLEQQDRAKEVADLDKEAARRVSRRPQIPARLVEARKALDALPAAVAEENTDPRLLAARRLRLSVERWRLEQELAALDNELASYDARDELLTVRRDLAARKSNLAKTVAEGWQAILQEHRAREADAARAAAQAEAERARAGHPLLAMLASANAEVTKELPELAALRQQLEQDTQRAVAIQQNVQTQFQDVQDRVERAGATPAIGALLRERRANLPNVSRELRRYARDYQKLAAHAYLEARDYEQRRRELTDDPELLDRLVRETQPILDDPRAVAALKREADALLRKRIEHLQTLKDGWSSYLGNLEKLEATQTAIEELVIEFRAFVNERVLWIRSSTPIWRFDVEAAIAGLRWIAAPSSWAGVGAALGTSLMSDVWPWAALALIGLGLFSRPLWLRRLRRHGELATRSNNTAYRPTALALLDTLVLAAPLPAILWIGGIMLGHSSDSTEFGQAIAAGALRGAAFLAFVRGLREIVRQGGLAERHFRWQPNTLSLMRRNLRLLLPAAFPLSVALGAIERTGDDAMLGSLGRLLQLPLFLLMLVFMWRVMHPASGLLRGSTETAFLGRFRSLWFCLGVGTPAALLVMMLLGYEYTAQQLARAVLHTLFWVVAGVLVHALVLRKLLLERRRLTIEQSRERRAAARAAVQASADADGATTGPASDVLPVVEEAEEEVQLDPSSVAKQTHTLVRGAIVLVVLFLAVQIWVDVLPALGVFDEVGLWTDYASEPPVDISLADVLLALLLLIATFVAATNLPGLLELLILQRLRIQSGERHAITTLARYALVAIGVIIAFSSIGLGWSKVQWLVAAISLGLGFGLQEIFANFVSGLILLFERPVRIGDWVAVGDVLGRVTRIKIRATTIRDIDNKELVVPNREFVTSRFVNWTLTDSFVRLRLPVGVAYGSDTVLARKLLLRAARECPFAAQSAPAKSLFLCFGESSLELELRVYVEDYERHADMLDDLHGRIDTLFREHGIEIAFPQRDLHVRSADPIVEFMHRRAPGEARTP